MSDWNTVVLGEVAEVFNGKTPSKAQQREHGHPVLKIKDVGEFGEFVGPFGSFVDHDLANANASKRVREGDTLILNAAHNAEFVASKTYRAQPATFGALATGEWLIVRPLEGRLHPGFFYHWVNCSQSRTALRHQVKGIHLYPKDVAGLEILLPPLSDQLRVATILDKADELRAKRRAALAQFDTLTQAVFLDMFGDPVTNLRSWPIKKLSEIGSVDRGVSKHRPRNAPELLGGPYPFVQTGDVTNSGGYIRRASGSYSEVGLRQSKLWPAGTLCITIAANIAQTGILTMDACFPDSVVGFRAQDSAVVQYVRVWLSFLQKMLEENAPSFAQKNINLDTLRTLDVPVPPLESMRGFVAVMEAIEAQKETMQSTDGSLETLFTALQHRAFRGEL